MRRCRRPTLRDIAHLAGNVHPSTVSLALRNQDGVAQATRERIQAIARQIGYRRDPLLDAFNQHRIRCCLHKRRPVVAYITDVRDHVAIQRRLWEAIQAAAARLHCQIAPFFIAGGDMRADRLDAILAARGVQAVIVGPFATNAPCLRMQWSKYCGIRIESLDTQYPGYFVTTDHRNSARMAVAELRVRGFRRIGLMLPTDVPRGQEALMRAGFLLAQHEFHPDERITTLELLPNRGAEERVQRWARQHHLDSVLTTSPLLHGIASAAAVPWACLEITGDDRKVSGMAPRFDDLADLAIEQVVARLRSNVRGDPRAIIGTYVPAEWRDGESLGGGASPKITVAEAGSGGR